MTQRLRNSRIARLPAWARWALGVALIAVLLIPLLMWGGKIAARFDNPEEVAAFIRAAGPWSAVLMVLLQILQTVIAPIPGQVVNFIAGYVFGFIPGVALSWVGMVLGTTLAMSLARFLGRPVVERLVSPEFMARADAALLDKGLRFFFLAFLIPLLPDDAICLVAGLTPLPLSLLILAAAVGRLPTLVATVWMGAHAGEMPWQLLVAAGVLSLILLALAWKYGDRVEDWVMARVARLKEIEP
jgi:uncharacterized membrane protein YdjX (TVP38/TMEM64 family)